MMVEPLIQDAGTAGALLERANDPNRPQVQGQAIRKLQELGAAAVEPSLAWVRKHGPRAMSQPFTQFLGELRDERVAALLAGLLADRDFYWRPAAAAALADHRSSAHRAFFRELLKDPLWGVRAGAIRGLELLDDRESKPALKALLNDAIHDVRSQAARTLHAMGDESGLPVLVEAMRSSVSWFDIDYGQLAREDAWKFLKQLAGDDFGFKPWESAAQRAPGLARWEGWIARKFPKWREMIPENARSTTDTSEYTFGYELRSCQRGDFFFRLDTTGNLVLGHFNIEKAALTKEERARFDAALAKLALVDADLPYGQGGCDFEQHYLRQPGGRFRKLWIGLGGRPEEIDPFIRVSYDLIKAKFGEGEAADFKQRAALFRAQD